MTHLSEYLRLEDEQLDNLAREMLCRYREGAYRCNGAAHFVRYHFLAQSLCLPFSLQ